MGVNYVCLQPFLNFRRHSSFSTVGVYIAYRIVPRVGIQIAIDVIKNLLINLYYIPLH